MIISINTFDGDKDNYYNFKQNFLAARENIRLSNLYLTPVTPMELNEKIRDLANILSEVEFED